MIGYGPNYSGGSGSGPGSGGLPMPTTTWATIPSVGPIGSQILVTDVGKYGSVYTSNGTIWAHTGEVEIIQKGKGWIVPSLAAANAATYSQSGTTITVTSTGHNILDLRYNTKDVYLEMGTATTGATIPPGWFSNFHYVDANTFTCVSATSQTGTGAVNTNLAEITIADLSATLKGGCLGLNGITLYSFLGSSSGSANAKSLKTYFGTDVISRTMQGVSVMEVDDYPIANRNSANSQVYNAGGFPVVIAVNTAVDFTLAFSVKSDVANDYVAIHSASVYIRIS